MGDWWQEDVAHIRCMAIRSSAVFSGERTCAVRGRLLSNKVPSSSRFLCNQRIVFLDGAQCMWNIALNLF